MFCVCVCSRVKELLKARFVRVCVCVCVCARARARHTHTHTHTPRGIFQQHFGDVHVLFLVILWEEFSRRPSGGVCLVKDVPLDCPACVCVCERERERERESQRPRAYACKVSNSTGFVHY
jgi:hypothetical protein